MKITLPDYFRIYSVIHAVLLSENADTNKSCSFYNYCGAYILNEHYKMPAKVYSGFVAYHLGEDKILGFGNLENNTLSSSKDKFHTWVEVDGWLIDFMAPEFSSVFNELNENYQVPRKMMQKSLSLMAENPDDLMRSGDFFLLPDLDVTNEIFAAYEAQPAFLDLTAICSQWFNRKKSKMKKNIQIPDGKASLKTVSFDKFKPLVGAW